MEADETGAGLNDSRPVRPPSRSSALPKRWTAWATACCSEKSAATIPVRPSRGSTRRSRSASGPAADHGVRGVLRDPRDRAQLLDEQLAVGRRESDLQLDHVLEQRLLPPLGLPDLRDVAVEHVGARDPARLRQRRRTSAPGSPGRYSSRKTRSPGISRAWVISNQGTSSVSRSCASPGPLDGAADRILPVAADDSTRAGLLDPERQAALAGGTLPDPGSNSSKYVRRPYQ